MIRTIIFFNIFGFIIALNSCKESCNNEQTNKNRSQSSILWKISGNGLKNDSHLYGTIHIRDNRVFKYGKIVETILQNSETLAVEVELDNINQITIVEATLMKDSVLNQLLAPHELDLLEQRYEEITGSSLRTAQRIKPFFLSANIVNSLTQKNTSIPLDLHFIKYAREHNKQVIGLETLNEQIDLIDKLSYSEQARMLFKTLTDSLDIETVFNSLLESYLKMDTDSLMQLINDPSIPEEFMKDILHERNQTMAVRLEGLIRESSVFCAVGAGHLFGTDGIIELLKEKGYKLEPVLFSFEE